MRLGRFHLKVCVCLSVREWRALCGSKWVCFVVFGEFMGRA